MDLISNYVELIKKYDEKYDAPKMRPAFNLAARRLAGFDEAELRQLAFYKTYESVSAVDAPSAMSFNRPERLVKRMVLRKQSVQ